MADFAYRHSYNFNEHKCRIVLCLFWIFGLLSGCGFLHFYKPFLFSQMRSAYFGPVSIVGLFCSVFLPLIFTYLSVITEKPVIIWIVCFLKAAAYSFSCTLVSQLFGDASWLFRLLFLFSDSFFLLALFILWFRRCGCERFSGRYDFLLCTALGFVIAAVDYFVISPFILGVF